jgi:hypothetical protein
MAAGVFGSQSNNVTGPSSNTYTLAGPTRYGVGTTMRWEIAGSVGIGPL